MGSGCVVGLCSLSVFRSRCLSPIHFVLLLCFPSLLLFPLSFPAPSFLFLPPPLSPLLPVRFTPLHTSFFYHFSVTLLQSHKSSFLHSFFSFVFLLILLHPFSLSSKIITLSLPSLYTFTLFPLPSLFSFYLRPQVVLFQPHA